MTLTRYCTALLIASTCLAPSAVAFQTGGRSATGLPPVRACDLLTKDVLAAHSPAAPESLKLMLSLPPNSDPVGPRGSGCSYGGVTLQVDPFGPASVDSLGKGKEFSPVPGLGDAAFYRANRSYYNELMVRSGPRVLTIQMSVPTGKTPQEILPNAVGLAKALLAKLK